jgi:hypothetical protein
MPDPVLDLRAAEDILAVLDSLPHAPECETWKRDTSMDTWICTCDIAERRDATLARLWTALLAALRDARAALERYGYHEPKCASLHNTKDRVYGMDFQQKACDCGLAAVLWMVKDE